MTQEEFRDHAEMLRLPCGSHFFVDCEKMIVQEFTVWADSYERLPLLRETSFIDNPEKYLFELKRASYQDTTLYKPRKPSRGLNETLTMFDIETP